MNFIACLLLVWTSAVADASQGRNIEKTKIGNEPLHPIDDMRIINGNNAYFGQVPHQVSLRSSDGSHFCGGSIISKDWIVTAAHCVVGQPLTQIRVVSGTISLVSGGTTHTATQSIVHPSYNPSPSAAFAYDYAVLCVSPAFTFNSYVKPIPLGYGTGGLICFASGWGRDDQGSNTLPSNLKYTWLIAFTDNLCRTQISGYVDEAHACTYRPPSNICNGDSGGPLTCWQNGGWKLFGIASFVFGNCDTGLPAGWADSASISGRTWIKSACGNCI